MVALVGATVVLLGLATRRYPTAFPEIVARYAGDTLWAVVAFCLCACIAPGARTSRLAALALGIAFMVELSQLLRWDWLEAVRDTRPGALALGHGFLWSDLACYTVGVLGAVVVDLAVLRVTR